MHILHILYIVYMVYIIYIVHSVYIIHILHILYVVYIVYIVHRVYRFYRVFTISSVYSGHKALHANKVFALGAPPVGISSQKPPEAAFPSQGCFWRLVAGNVHRGCIAVLCFAPPGGNFQPEACVFPRCPSVLSPNWGRGSYITCKFDSCQEKTKSS